MKVTIAGVAGSCGVCGCRYRPGEMIGTTDRAEFHVDCYRTRDSIELRPYESQQPVEMDLLLLAINNDGLSTDQDFPGPY
jgi:hypothetical protein